jgi:hypothetical protein
LRASEWSVRAVAREVGVSRSATNRTRGYKSYRKRIEIADLRRSGLNSRSSAVDDLSGIAV